jgi:hypothetical protein
MSDSYAVICINSCNPLAVIHIFDQFLDNFLNIAGIVDADKPYKVSS